MSGSTRVRDELVEQFKRSFKMLQSVIDNIPAAKWKEDVRGSFIPAAVAYHTVETLDFYFCGKTSDQFVWGYRFRGPWWSSPEEDLPTREEVLVYLEEVEERVAAYLDSREDDDLAQTFDTYEWSGGTVLGHSIYAIRHTMHHQGQLAALQFQYGIEGDTWQ
jgi:hypothetical protein